MNFQHRIEDDYVLITLQGNLIGEESGAPVSMLPFNGLLTEMPQIKQAYLVFGVVYIHQLMIFQDEEWE